MLTDKEILDFVNFALGDFADPKAFEVVDYNRSKAVILRYSGLVYAPKEVLYSEWKQAVNDNPKFADIKLFL